MRSAARLLAGALLLLTGAAGAHPLAPALLQLESKGEGVHAVTWRLYAAQVSVPRPRLPAGCAELDAPVYQVPSGGALTARWQVRCGPGSLAGQRLAVEGLDTARINVLVRVIDDRGRVQEALLDARRPELLIAPAGTADGVVLRYFGLGVAHLVGGPDHLLFLLGLLVLVGARRRLVLVVTAFTVGHSLTLMAVSLDLVTVDPRLAELAIALTLLWLAREILSPGAGPLRRWPAVGALLFGLIHGLGFAGALTQLGLPTDAILPALLAFNLGIEAGQLLVLGGAVALLRLRLMPKLAGPRLAAYLTGCLAGYWCLDRGLPVLIG